jgi:hypothetical protein
VHASGCRGHESRRIGPPARAGRRGLSRCAAKRRPVWVTSRAPLLTGGARSSSNPKTSERCRPPAPAYARRTSRRSSATCPSPHPAVPPARAGRRRCTPVRHRGCCRRSSFLVGVARRPRALVVDWPVPHDRRDGIAARRETREIECTPLGLLAGWVTVPWLDHDRSQPVSEPECRESLRQGSCQAAAWRCRRCGTVEA